VGGYIKMDFGEIKWIGVYCTGLPQDRDWCRALVIAVMSLIVP
jgi:hypothetical protein